MPYKLTGRPPGRPKKKPPLKEYEEEYEEPKLSEAQWRALAVEDGTSFRSRPAALVAQYAGVSRQTIYTWRKDPLYNRGLSWLKHKKLLSNLDARETKATKPKPTEKTIYARTYVYMKKHWPGSVSIHLADGSELTFTDLDEYVSWIIESGFASEDAV